MDAQLGVSRALRQIFLAAVAFGLLAAGTAIAATFPVDDGNGFDANTEGWTATSASCEPSAGPLCTVANAHATDQGSPPGSIASRMSVLANAGGLFQGLGTWRSPTFKATVQGSGALRYDRRIETAGLLTLGPEVTIESVLVNESSGNSKSLGSETLDSGDSAFVNHPVAVAENTLKSGDNYHLELRATLRTTQAQAGILGSVAVRYDNVALQVANTGPGGSSGSPGVTFPEQPLSNKEINAVAQQPGVSRKQCTILGTPKADRIRGSRRNDVICGLGGNDRITGRGGRDVIDAGAGKDRVGGNAKADKILAKAGKDRLRGGAGGDRINGGKGRDRLAGNGGNDRLAGGAGRDRVNGGPGRRDRVLGGTRDKVTKVERPR